MAKRPSPELIKRKFASDLIQLQQILQSGNANEVIINPEALLSAANNIQMNGLRWEYRASGLQLRVPVPQNCLPSCCIGYLLIEINLDLKGDFEDFDSQPADMLKHLTLDIVIQSESHSNICAWHFDRHIGDEPSTEAHPRFHFQHGGHAMTPFSDRLGDSLVLPAPRLAFPPMDAILAIDFILSNFAGECWKSLRSDPTYRRLLVESQECFWKPYIQRLASWWDKGPKSIEKITDFFPHLIA